MLIYLFIPHGSSVIGSGSRELAAFWSFNEVQEDRAGSTGIVPVSFAVSALCVPESSPAGDVRAWVLIKTKRFKIKPLAKLLARYLPQG